MTNPAAHTVALVLVGDELLTGHTTDLNGSWLGRRLAEAGLWVVSATITPDDESAVVRAVERGLDDARAVVVTGGLGPTSDDVTRAALARLAGGRAQSELPNEVGSEPGARIESGPGVVYAVPGVPAEMRSMIEGQVLEELVAAAGELPQRVTRSLVVVGLGEPRVAELLAPVEQSMVGRGRLSYLPRPAEVEVRLVLTGAGAETLAAASVALARNLLGDALAAEDQALEDAVVGLLRSRHQTVATAESLTAGMLAAALVSVAGASEVMRGGVVAYATDLKAVLADVPTEVLERHGAVAAVTAAAMARGARARCRADLGVATTGVAGPDPQEGHHPGTFHVAVASADVTRVGSYAPTAQRRDRETIRRLAVVRALDLLRRTAAGLGPATGESRPRPTR